VKFEDAIDALAEGKMVSRIGWCDPSRFCYLILLNEEGGGQVHGVRMYGGNALTIADSEANDWYVQGYVQ
jgi:hypothetical protein